MDKWIAITGNPVDGFSYYGPFENHEGAITFAEKSNFDGDWWIALLHNKPILLSYRQIGYTAEECERDMRRLTNGERGCSAPDEHSYNRYAHMEKSGA